MSQKFFPPHLPPGMPDPIPDPVGWIAEKTSKWLTEKFVELNIGKKRKDNDDD